MGWLRCETPAARAEVFLRSWVVQAAHLHRAALRCGALQARRTQRLGGRLTAIGLALGGAAGARLSRCLGLNVSHDTLLRLVRRVPLPTVSTPSILGVDDWAHRKGKRYGTIRVDLECRRPVTLLNERKAETLADWLRDHPGVTVLCRDRMKASIDAARAGAPGAIQVADRFPLWQNLAEALDQVFSAHSSALKAVWEGISAEPVTGREGTVRVPPTPPTAIEEVRAKQRRARRWANYEQIWARHCQGWSNRAIAKQLGIGRMTVVRYLQAPVFPERKGRSDKGKSLLNPSKEYLLKQWNRGCREARRLFREIQRKGYTGSYATVARYASRLCQAQGLRPWERRPGARLPMVIESFQRPLTTPRATSLVLQRSEKRQPEDEQLITRIKAQHIEMATTIELARDFAEIVRQRQPGRFDGWLA